MEAVVFLVYVIRLAPPQPPPLPHLKFSFPFLSLSLSLCACFYKLSQALQTEHLYGDLIIHLELWNVVRAPVCVCVCIFNGALS